MTSSCILKGLLPNEDESASTPQKSLAGAKELHSPDVVENAGLTTVESGDHTVLLQTGGIRPGSCATTISDSKFMEPES